MILETVYPNNTSMVQCKWVANEVYIMKLKNSIADLEIILYLMWSK